MHNTIKREVLYLGIVSPGPVWMGRKAGSPGKKLKPMSGAEAAALEAAYQRYLILNEQDLKAAGAGKTAVSHIIQGRLIFLVLLSFIFVFCNNFMLRKIST